MLKLETARLRFRELSIDDLEPLRFVFEDAEVMRFSVTGPIKGDEVLNFIQYIIGEREKNAFGVYTLVHKDSGDLIGICGLNPIEIDDRLEVEVLYRLAKAYWQNGYATEAAKAIMNYAFDAFGLISIIAIVDPENTASLNVVNKLGMAYEKDTVHGKSRVRLYRKERPSMQERLSGRYITEGMPPVDYPYSMD